MKREITITDCPGGKDMIITMDEKQQKMNKNLVDIVLEYNGISREDWEKDPSLDMKLKYPSEEEFETINALYKAVIEPMKPIKEDE